MLRITVSKNAASATKYFEDGLSRQDYYAEKNEIKGKWGGKASEQLKLSDEVTKADFEKLASNINPVTNEKMTVRDSANRRAGYDFTFSVPKSVSLAHAVTGDKEILSTFENAVSETMKEIEKSMQTQTGQGKNKHYETTANMAWASFTHFNARPVDGIPDPHMHQHVFVFNTTWNEKKERFQAGEFSQLHIDRPFYEADFNARLARNLQKVGYNIERNERDFELAGFGRNLIDKYSNRTQEIEKSVLEKGITYAEDKGRLGAKTRESKNKGLSETELSGIWKSRLTHEEKVTILTAKGGDGNLNNEDKVSAKAALDYALEHNLERQSAISEKRMLGDAVKRGYGSLMPSDILKEYESRKDILKSQNRRTGEVTITTKSALAEEKKLIAETRNGKAQFEPINPDFKPKNEQLTIEQKNAVSHVLGSKDLVSAITGGAGTGKTWSIKEVKDGITSTGMGFHAFAPSADASRGVQREEGFSGAETVASLLQNKQLQEQTKNGMIWIDEAGMVGNKTMNQILSIAKEQNARVLLTGDIKQHNAVERGDAFRVMQEYGGMKPALISKIQRQKTADYKNAVDAISKGKVEDGYLALDKMGAIKEVVDMQTLKTSVALEYVDSVKKKENVLVVATTHAQGREATHSIREGLKSEGILSKKESIFDVHKDKSFTDAEKKDGANYKKGLSIQFHQNIKGGFKRGTKYDVIGKDDKGNVLIAESGANKSGVGEKKKEVESKILPLPHSAKFSVYEKRQLALSEGDKIRISQNGFSNEKKRLNNGNILSVKGFDKDGNILAKRGKTDLTLDKNYRNFTHGYYTTSPASQGKSVERVIIMQSKASGKAASKEQFYVSASRGKFAISVYTDDKDFMLKSVQRSSQRQTAMEVAKEQPSKKERFKKEAGIYRAAFSKVKDLWSKSKQSVTQLMKEKTQHVKPKAPIRTR